MRCAPASAAAESRVSLIGRRVSRRPVRGNNCSFLILVPTQHSSTTPATDSRVPDLLFNSSKPPVLMISSSWLLFLQSLTSCV